MKRSLLALTLLAASTGCGTAYRPSQTAHLAIDREASITDADVQKAFDAKPQLPARFSVAFYSFDDERAKDVEAMLASSPKVTSVYRIPGLAVTGKRRFDRHDRFAPKPKITVKQLRLLAARAKADVLVVVDAGYRTGGANPLAALNALIIPVFFVPFIDNQVESYIEAYVFDTRNGYLYGHLTEEEKGGPEYATIYDESADVLVKEQWARLRGKMRTSLDALVDAEQAETRRAQKSRSKKKRSETALKAQRPGPDTKLGAVATHGGTGKK